MAKAKRQTGEDGYALFKKELRDRNFGRLNVIFGEESYLVMSCRNALKNKLVDPLTEDFNYHRFTQENWNPEAFQEAVEAIPMMSESSMVEVLDVNFFGMPETERDQMAEILSDIPEYCTILLVYDAVEFKPDKRMKKLYSAMDGVWHRYEMVKQPENVLGAWILRELRKVDKNMSDDTIRYLIMQTGGSMTILAAELQKLICYTDQHEVRKNDIDAVVIPVLEAMIFDITRDIGSKDFDAALVKIQNLLNQDTEPIAINAVIGRQFRQMYGAKVLAEHGKGAYDLIPMFGIRDFAAKEIYGQARGYKKPQLKAGMRLCAEADLSMKTSIADASNILVQLVVQLSQLSQEKR